MATTKVQDHGSSRISTAALSSGNVSGAESTDPSSTTLEPAQDLTSMLLQMFHQAATALSTVNQPIFETALAQEVRSAATRPGSILKEAVKALPPPTAPLQPLPSNITLPEIKIEYSEGHDVENPIRIGSGNKENNIAHKTSAQARDTSNSDSRKRRRATTEGSGDEDSNLNMSEKRNKRIHGTFKIPQQFRLQMKILSAQDEDNFSCPTKPEGYSVSTAMVASKLFGEEWTFRPTERKLYLATFLDLYWIPSHTQQRKRVYQDFEKRFGSTPDLERVGYQPYISPRLALEICRENDLEELFHGLQNAFAYLCEDGKLDKFTPRAWS